MDAVLARKVREVQAELLVLEERSVTFNGAIIQILSRVLDGALPEEVASMICRARANKL